MERSSSVLNCSCYMSQKSVQWLRNKTLSERCIIKTSVNKTFTTRNHYQKQMTNLSVAEWQRLWLEECGNSYLDPQSQVLQEFSTLWCLCRYQTEVTVCKLPHCQFLGVVCVHRKQLDYVGPLSEKICGFCFMIPTENRTVTAFWFLSQTSRSCVAVSFESWESIKILP